MEQEAKYGIGEQDFKSLRERGCVYIDKTGFIEKIVRSGAKYYFLARPRRFGKSLFLSTLNYFFKGERELFKGLRIDSAERVWESYPVLRLDLNMEKYADLSGLDYVLDSLFKEWEDEYGVTEKAPNMPVRFRNIIRAAHEKTGKQVVILVDEYDKPLVGNINRLDRFETFLEKLGAIYTTFKSSAEHIRLVFLTGVSRFGKLNVFSDLNNLKDISFSNEFADICGITEQELVTQLKSGVERFALANGTDTESALADLKRNYDGYRFAENGSDIYNPWSLLNSLEQNKIDTYWIDSGLPTLIVESLKKSNAVLENLFDRYCSASDLKGLDLRNPDQTALMYQTGYLTIKDYFKETNEYLLGIPNLEVKNGFFNYLLPCYVSSSEISPKELVTKIVRSFLQGKPDDAMKAMQSYFAGIDYKLKIENENNFHNAFFLLTDLIGLNTSTEVSTSDGSIDILIKTSRYIYIIELKYDHSAGQALRQIEDKQYARPYREDGRKIFEIGVNFSSKTRCIEDWIIEER